MRAIQKFTLKVEQSTICTHQIMDGISMSPFGGKIPLLWTSSNLMVARVNPVSPSSVKITATSPGMACITGSWKEPAGRQRFYRMWIKVVEDHHP